MTLNDRLKDLLRLRDGTGHAIDIDIDRMAIEARDTPVPREDIWHESSFDLQHGLDVSEKPLDSMPIELIDVFRKS